MLLQISVGTSVLWVGGEKHGHYSRSRGRCGARGKSSPSTGVAGLGMPGSRGWSVSVPDLSEYRSSLIHSGTWGREAHGSHLACGSFAWVQLLTCPEGQGRKARCINLSSAAEAVRIFSGSAAAEPQGAVFEEKSGQGAKGAGSSWFLSPSAGGKGRALSSGVWASLVFAQSSGFSLPETDSRPPSTGS